MSQDVIVLSDRIKELSHSTGLGNFILDGAVQGFSTFSSFYSYNDALFYAITDGTNYEVGSGQYILDGSNKSLKRFPFRSTNSNNLVNFTNGAKEVYVTYPGKYSVFTASGLANFQQPQSSGLAFWGSDQILDYDSNIVWNTSQNKLGISQNNPSYAIDVGGLSSYSAIRASGFIVGNSGILFPLDRQLEPFLRNELDVTTGTEAVFNLEGTVDEQIKFKIQHASWVFAGPTGNCTLNPSCPSGYPTFRILHINDIPDLSNLYVQQKSTAYGDSLPNGMMSGIAFWNQSGIIDYDSYLVWNKTNNYLGVNTKTPAANLDVDGNAIIRTNLTVGGNVTVTGNLDIQGSTTYIDSTVVTILDKQLELASMSGAAIYNDASIDDAGIVIKSTDSDKKWTWRDSNDAWTTDQKLKTSGIIFNDLSVISGAYQAGSGLTLHNGLKFNIGNMFSTQTSDNSQLLVHQADVITVSGISGIKTYLDSANKRIVINPFDLIANQNIQDLANTNSGIAISGWANSTINASGNFLNDKIISVSGWASSSISSVSGWNKQYTDNQISTASGYSYWNIDDGIGGSENITNGISVFISGVSGINTAYDPTLGIMKVSAGSLSGWANSTINASGNLLNDKIISVSGWASSSISSVSGWNKQYTDSQASGVIASGYSYWTVSDGVGSSENISNTNTVYISGVTGINTIYSSATNIVRISAASLSGWSTNYTDTKINNLASVSGYNYWTINDGIGGSENINNSGIVFISGVSGIDTSYDVSSNIMRISSASLSGWNKQYTDSKVNNLASISGYNYWTINDGIGGSENINNSGIVFISGVSGIDTSYDVSSNIMKVSAGSLSGWTSSSISSVSGWNKQYTDSQISAASGFTYWNINDGVGGSENITNGISVFISGVSGISTSYNTSTNIMSISSAPISGWNQQYTDSRINALAAASGYTSWNIDDGIGNSENITNTTKVYISGVTGIDTLYNSTSNIMKVSAASLSGWAKAYIDSQVLGAGSYTGWTVSDGIGSSENISNATTLHISGVSGVSTQYDSSSNVMRISAGLLNGTPSGVVFFGNNSQLSRSNNLIYDSGNSRVHIITAVPPYGQNFTYNILLQNSGNLAQNHGAIAIGRSGAFFGYIENPFTLIGGKDSSTHPRSVFIGGGDFSASPAKFVHINIADQNSIDTSGYKTPILVSGYSTPSSSKYASVLIQDSNLFITTDSADLAFKNAEAFIRPALIGNVGIRVQARSTQTANLQEWKDGAGGISSRIDSQAKLITDKLITINASPAIHGLGDIKISGSYCGFDTNIKVGNTAGSSSVSNTQTIMIGQSAGQSSIGCDSTNMIGYTAGYSATGCDYTNMIGQSAGQQATGCNSTNMIGNSAGYGASGCNSTNMIGQSAGQQASGCSYTNMIGQSAGYLVSGCLYTNMIGVDAGRQATGCNSTNMIGQYAGYSATGCDFTNMIGQYAGQQATGCDFTNMIGVSAGRQASGCNFTNMIGGLYTGRQAIWCDYTNMIGYGAGYFASGCSETVMIGTEAGYGATGCYESEMIGRFAGRNANLCTNSIMFGELAGSGAIQSELTSMIGTSAGRSARLATFSNMIGNKAGMGSVGCTASNFIGYESGSGCTSSYSTYIGYKAGTNNQFNNNIFIKALNTSHTLDWISPTIQGLQANLLSIADTITGDTSLKYIRIGQTGIMGDINDATLTVKPKLATDTAVKIFRATSQSVPLLVSELSTAANNTIISKDGFLTIPTYNNVATATGAIPVNNVGAMAFAISENVFLISNGSNWKKSAAFSTV